MREPSDNKNTSLLATCQAINKQVLEITKGRVINAEMAKPFKTKDWDKVHSHLADLMQTYGDLDRKRSNPKKLLMHYFPLF